MVPALHHTTIVDGDIGGCDTDEGGTDRIGCRKKRATSTEYTNQSHLPKTLRLRSERLKRTILSTSNDRHKISSLAILPLALALSCYCYTQLKWWNFILIYWSAAFTWAQIDWCSDMIVCALVSVRACVFYARCFIIYPHSLTHRVLFFMNQQIHLVLWIIEMGMRMYKCLEFWLIIGIGVYLRVGLKKEKYAQCAYYLPQTIAHTHSLSPSLSLDTWNS